MRTILTYLALAVCTSVFGSLVIVATALGIPVRPHGFMERIPSIYCRVVLRAAGVRLRIHNADRASGGAHIYISNHMSWFDVFSLASFLPRYRFIAKKELQRIPIFGPAVSKIAGIYIDRGNRKAAFDTYTDAAERVRTGLSVVVFPEGTRGRTYELRPFKKGPFVLALAAQVPIVPVILHGTREVQGKGAVRVTPGEVEVSLLEPIPTAGLTYEDRDALMRIVWERMAAEMQTRYGVRSGDFAIDTRSGAA